MAYSRDFLTGFHKRKAQRQKKAADYVKEQARKERIETRKEVICLDDSGNSRFGMLGKLIFKSVCKQ